MLHEVTAIIVARAGSRRLPNKAMLPFPPSSTLIGHKIDQLKQCKQVSRIVVGSDGDEILAEAQAHGAQVIRRDAFHCDEERCNARDMISDMMEKIAAEGGAEWILWAHPTNPLIKPETYAAAITRFGNRPLHYDSLCSVTAIHRHGWHCDRPINHDPWSGPHRCGHELKPIMLQDGGIFIQRFEQMRANHYFYGSRPFLFVLDAKESIDIDTRDDYELALAEHQRQAVMIHA